MKKVSQFRVSPAAIFLLCLVTAIASHAQTFKLLVNFDGTDGAGPGGVVQGLDGNLYGTTGGGGNNGSVCLGTGCGTVFKVTPGGVLTTLYSFCSQANCADGVSPVGALVPATDGNFYGITANGGLNNTQLCAFFNGCGTIFKVTPGGVLTTLYSFCSQTNCADGSDPYASLVEASDGNFYGTTSAGGSGYNLSVCAVIGCGTVFKITPTGTLTTLHSFCTEGGAACTDGWEPLSGLIQGRDGNLYGTTERGGANGDGIVFKITLTGTLTTLYSFCAQPGCPDGDLPAANLVQATDGYFYGTTYFGGAFELGTIFKITPTGTLTTIYQFQCTTGPACSGGGYPSAGLIQATDGNFYGTTTTQGLDDAGTVFKITPTGTLTTLHRFHLTDGSQPSASLMQSTSGIFYGTAHLGGVSFCSSPGCGTLFAENLGLGPFVETLPTIGKVGSKLFILGTKLSGTTSVTFNGTAATFTVVSNTEIVTSVPAGATTGTVKVATPSGTLTSNVVFRVRP